MTRSGVRLKLVEERLARARECVEELRSYPAANLEEFLADNRTFPASESRLRWAIEAIFDTARHLLAKAHGQGALEYRQVALLAQEKGLIQDPALGARFVQIAGFRNRLIHHYEDVTAAELFEIVRKDLGDLDALIEALEKAGRRLTPAEGET